MNFFIGTAHDIYRISLDEHTGQLGAPTVAARVADSNYLAFSPDRRFLYLAQPTRPTQLTGFAVTPEGELSRLNTVECGGEASCHVAVDAEGRRVFVANYGSGEMAAVERNPDGTLGKQTALLKFQGSGPSQARQDSSHPHQVVLHPSNRFLYSCDLGADKIWSFRFDSASGALTALQPPAASVPPGSGCRHLAFNPNGRFAYVVNELSLTVSVFSCDLNTGELTLIQTAPMLEPGVAPGTSTAAGIACHPSGQLLFVSNRGCDTLCCFRISAAGTLDSLQTVPSVVHSPRGFALDDRGQWLVVGGEKSNNLAAFRIDPGTGALTQSGSLVEVPAPMCMLFQD